MILFFSSFFFSFFDKHAKTSLDKVMNIREIYVGLVFFLFWFFVWVFVSLGQLQLSISWMHLIESFHTILSIFLETIRIYDNFSNAPYLTLGTSSSSNMRVGLSDPP